MFLSIEFGARASRGREGGGWQGPCFLWDFMLEHGPRHPPPSRPQEALASVPLKIRHIVRHPSALESLWLGTVPLRVWVIVRESESITTKGD